MAQCTRRASARHSSISAKQECDGPGTGNFVMTGAPSCHWLPSAQRFAVIIESRQCPAVDHVQPLKALPRRLFLRRNYSGRITTLGQIPSTDLDTIRSWCVRTLVRQILGASFHVLKPVHRSERDTGDAACESSGSPFEEPADPRCRLTMPATRRRLFQFRKKAGRSGPPESVSTFRRRPW
jgi:hypothetical protein